LGIGSILEDGAKKAFDWMGIGVAGLAFVGIFAEHKTHGYNNLPSGTSMCQPAAAYDIGAARGPSMFDLSTNPLI